ncbi:hypothetical protein MKY27_00100 [Solibacillus sp. FSL R5-0449]|uniref:hypothetical protein n=1 Tax=Solibacillus sp. FSL R5-0449 TaxID=2921639 RepID=UPI0030D519C5
MKSFQTLEEANNYFETALADLDIEYEQKLLMIEKNEQQVALTLKKQYEQQKAAIVLQHEQEENKLKQNRDQAIEKIEMLFANKRKVILDNFKNAFEEEKKNYQVNKIELLEQKQAEERRKFQTYTNEQQKLLSQFTYASGLTDAMERAIDNLHQELTDILIKYNQQFDDAEQLFEERCHGLEQRRDEAIETLIDNEAASQSQLDDQLFEALQDLSEKTEKNYEQIEQNFMEKEQSLQEMVFTQQEKINADYDEQREKLFKLQEQALAQFD